MTDPYSGREQTRAKHFILKSYLQALAFKVLTFSNVTYIDGFSGPWETKTENFSDSSFMIAINVLQDAQKQILERTGVRRRIRCFFSENDPEAFAQLHDAVAQFDRPEEDFEIKLIGGKPTSRTSASILQRLARLKIRGVAAIESRLTMT